MLNAGYNEKTARKVFLRLSFWCYNPSMHAKKFRHKTKTALLILLSVYFVLFSAAHAVDPKGNATPLAEKLTAFVETVSGGALGSKNARFLKLEGQTVYLDSVEGAPPGRGAVLRVMRVTSTITDPKTGEVIAEEGKTIGYAVIEKASEKFSSGKYIYVENGQTEEGIEPSASDKVLPVRDSGRVAFIWQNFEEAEAEAVAVEMDPGLKQKNLSRVKPDEIILFLVENGLESTADVLKPEWRDAFMETVRADFAVEVSKSKKGEYDIFSFSVYLPKTLKAALEKRELGNRSMAFAAAPPSVPQNTVRAPGTDHEIPLADYGDIESWSAVSRLVLEKKIPHEIVGAVFADGDGDGVYEFVYAANDRLFISSSITGEVLWESPSTKGMKLNSIMAADLDGNGREEIYVNYVHYSNIKSMIAVNENGRWEIKQMGLPYYFSGTDHGGILAQKSDIKYVAGLTVYGVKYDGNEIRLEKLFTLPNSGPVGLSRISDNPALLVGTSRYKKLTVYNEKGNQVAFTTELKTGSNQAVDLPIKDTERMDVTAGSSIPFVLLGIKFLKLPYASRTVVAVPENIGKLFSLVSDYIGSYKTGRIRVVEFNSDKDFETLTATPFIEDWVITSIFTNPGSNNMEIYAAANYTGKKSRGRIYRLVIPKQ